MNTPLAPVARAEPPVDWSGYARRYDDAWDNHLSASIAVEVMRALPRDAVVLDVGAGTGLITGRLVAAGWQVAATEPNAAMVARFAARLPDVPITQADVLASLDLFEAGGFDALVCTNVVQFLSPADVDHLVVRGDRIVVDGGSVVLCAPTRRITSGRVITRLVLGGEPVRAWRFRRAHQELRATGTTSGQAQPDPLRRWPWGEVRTICHGLQRLVTHHQPLK